MKKYLFLSIPATIILLIIMPSLASSADFIHGIARLSGKLADGKFVKVEVQTVKITPQYPYKHALLWGAMSRAQAT